MIILAKVFNYNIVIYDNNLNCIVMFMIHRDSIKWKFENKNPKTKQTYF